MPSRPLRFSALPLLALAALAACGDKSATPGADSAAPAASAPTAGSRSADAELADITAYRLDMGKIDKYIAAQSNILDRGEKLTAAEREAMRARTEARGDNQNASMDDMVKQIESEPLMIGAIQDAGLTAREFAMITISMMQSAMASSVAAMQPNVNQDSLIREMKANPDNVKFYREHEAEIMQKTKSLEARAKKMQGDEG